MNSRKIKGNSDYEVSNSHNHESSLESCGDIVKEKVNRRKQNEQITFKSKKHGPWNKIQEIKFMAYVQTHIKIFQDKDLRRRKKVFRQMAKYVKSRSSQQCRSHHQKYQIRYSTHQNMLEQLKIKLKVNQDLTQKPNKKYIKKLDPNLFFVSQEDRKPSERVFDFVPTQRGEEIRSLTSLNEVIIGRGEGYEILQTTVGSLEYKIVLDLQRFFI